MENELLALIIQYISVPVGFGLILIGLYAPTKRIKLLKYEFSSGALFIVCGLILVLVAFPVAQFLKSLTQVVKQAPPHQ